MSFAVRKEVRVFTTILLPLDGSHESEQAMRFAVGLAKQVGADLVLARAFEPARHTTQISGLDQPQAMDIVVRQTERRDQARVAQARSYLEGMSAQAKQQGVGVVHHLLMEPGGKALLKVVRDYRVDLIVMASRGRTGLHRALLGSVADELVRGSPCPVLLVGPAAAGRRARTRGK